MYPKPFFFSFSFCRKAELIEAPSKSKNSKALLVVESDPRRFVQETLNAIKDHPEDFWRYNLMLEEKPARTVVIDYRYDSVST